MILYVLRHGIAEDAAPGGDDAARRLTPRGVARMRAAARGMRAMRLRLDALLTSPLPRASETAAIVAEAFGGTPAARVLPALAPGVGAAETLRALRAHARQAHVMVVGHQPGLGMLVSLVLTGSPEAVSVDLKKGGLVALEVSDISGHPAAALGWMSTPRQLRRLGR